MNYGTSFEAWRAAAGETWPAYTRHAFVRGMGDGTLPRAAFLHYLKQDYVFLIHFARAWALVVTKAESVADMRLAAGRVNALINDELALHIGICAEAGISEEELIATQERQANLAYTRYVLDAGHSGDMLDLLATLAPCVMGYGVIGAELSVAKTSETYADWINTYGGEDYQQVCCDVGALIDGVVARRIGDDPQNCPRWANLCDRFHKATELEVGFWGMASQP
jgi:thiaminase/transcriptional activator TenA